jgi:hypothetical protein
VGLWIESSLVRMGAAAAAQVVLGVWALRRVRHRSARGRWLLDNDVSRGPTFQPGHALRALGVGILFGLPGLALFSCLVFGTWIESATARFVTFDANGIHASAREYRRGDRTVHLVGMMHIGEGDAYREIFESFTGESTIVLEEGVTDDQALLGEGGFYDRVAGSLGLDVQPPFAAITSEQPASATGAPWPDVRRADIDASQFTPETIAFLAALSKVYQSPDLTTALRRFESSLGDIDVQTTNGVIHDLITRRNAHLIEVLREALETHERVVVPWGALHLREIEQTLLEWDFVHQASTQRRLTRYLTIARALTTEAEPLDPLRDD